MAACIILAIWSEAPPAPAATTISTGLEGSQATAGPAVSANKASVLHLANLMTPPRKTPPAFSLTGSPDAKTASPPCAGLPLPPPQGVPPPTPPRLSFPPPPHPQTP